MLHGGGSRPATAARHNHAAKPPRSPGLPRVRMPRRARVPRSRLPHLRCGAAGLTALNRVTGSLAGVPPPLVAWLIGFHPRLAAATPAHRHPAAQPPARRCRSSPHSAVPPSPSVRSLAGAPRAPSPPLTPARAPAAITHREGSHRGDQRREPRGPSHSPVGAAGPPRRQQLLQQLQQVRACALPAVPRQQLQLMQRLQRLQHLLHVVRGVGRGRLDRTALIPTAAEPRPGRPSRSPRKVSGRLHERGTQPRPRCPRDGSFFQLPPAPPLPRRRQPALTQHSPTVRQPPIRPNEVGRRLPPGARTRRGAAA